MIFFDTIQNQILHYYDYQLQRIDIFQSNYFPQKKTTV